MDEIQKRLDEITVELSNEDITAEQLKTLNDEVDALTKRKSEIIKNVEDRKNTLSKVAQLGNAKEQIADEGKENKEMKSEDIYSTKEYRSAFLKNLLGRDLDEAEKRAFVHTTDMDAAPVPTQMVDEIWDLISGEHSILDDITIYRTGTAIQITTHTTVTAGRAKNVAQGTANENEQNGLAKVTLSGKDFSKTVELSYAMAKMSIKSFEQYLKTEIATQFGEVLAEDTIAQIKTDVNAANKITTAEVNKVDYTDVTKLFGLLKKAKNHFVYCNETTLYNALCSMTDTTGRPLYQPSINDKASGVLLGGLVKMEDALADGEILVGDSKKVVMNMVQDIMIEDDKDIKAHTYIYSGYARGESKLLYDKAFALLTVKTA